MKKSIVNNKSLIHDSAQIIFLKKFVLAALCFIPSNIFSLSFEFYGKLETGAFLEERMSNFEMGKTFYWDTEINGKINFVDKNKFGIDVSAEINQNRAKLKNFNFFYEPIKQFRFKVGVIDNDSCMEKDAKYLERTDLLKNLMTVHLEQNNHTARGLGVEFYNSKKDDKLPIHYNAGILFSDTNYLINIFALLEYKIRNDNTMNVGVRYSHLQIPISTIINEENATHYSCVWELFFKDYNGMFWEFFEVIIGKNSNSATLLNYYENNEDAWFFGAGGFFAATIPCGTGGGTAGPVIRFGPKASVLFPDMTDWIQWNFQTAAFFAVLPIKNIKIEISGGPLLSFYKINNEYFRKIAGNIKAAISFSI
ncbi:MAG: hypothetical protein J1G30_01755 [Spirochaetales bacterium]|nr:hypothetical protein [Spirochaetales bacterium]